MARFCGKCGSPCDPATGLCPKCDPVPVGDIGGKRKKNSGQNKGSFIKWLKIFEKCLAIALALTIVITGTLWVLAAIDHNTLKENEVKTDEGKSSSKKSKNTPESELYTPDGNDFAYDEDSDIAFINNIVLVFFNKGTEDTQINEVVQALDGKIVGKIVSVNQYQIEVETSSLDELRSKCERAEEFDCVMKAIIDEVVPTCTDEYYNDPWGSESWDESDDHAKTWWPNAINAPEAWEYAGELSKVSVGVVDNGFDTNHEDLKDKIKYVSPENTKELHGTHVAGLVGAVGDNGKGICGTAPNSELLLWDYESNSAPKGTYEGDGGTIWSYTSRIVGGTIVLLEKGAKVINLSAGVTGMISGTERYEGTIDREGEYASTYLTAYLTNNENSDFVIVQSAGNGNSSQNSVDAKYNGFFASINYDNCVTTDKVSVSDILDRIIIVGAADKVGDEYMQAEWSNAGDRVDICAPGVKIYSTVPDSDYDNTMKIGEEIYDISGTSMAAPIVAGVCALAWGSNPALSGAQIKDIVTDSYYSERVEDNPSKKHPLTNSYYMVNAERSVETAMNTTPEGGGETYTGDPVSSKRDVVLVLDVSGSMDGTPLEETKKAAEKFVDTVLPHDTSVGVVAYSDDAELKSSIIDESSILKNVVSGLRTVGATNIDEGLQKAEEMLDESDADKKIIVLMSDGQPNRGRVDEELIDYSKEIKDKGYYIYTLGFFDEAENRMAAQKLMEKLASEGCHYEVSDSDDLVFFFEDIGNQIRGTRYIYIRIACPVNVEVECDGETLSSDEDDLNTRTSFGNLTFEDSEEEEGETVKILRLKEGENYDIKVEGYDSGRMDYTMALMNSKGEYKDFRRFNNIKITDDTVIDSVAANTDKTQLKVDQDGDGKYDYIYEAKANSKGVLVSYSVYLTIIIWAGAALLLLIAIHIAAVVISKKRKERY